MWRDILKVQILDTVTDLNIDLEPMTEDKKDCCHEAKEAFIAAFGDSTKESFWGFSTYVREESCKRFKHELMLIQGHKRDPNRPKVIKILNDWEACENE